MGFLSRVVKNLIGCRQRREGHACRRLRFECLEDRACPTAGVSTITASLVYQNVTAPIAQTNPPTTGTDGLQYSLANFALRMVRIEVWDQDVGGRNLLTAGNVYTNLNGEIAVTISNIDVDGEAGQDILFVVYAESDWPAPQKLIHLL